MCLKVFRMNILKSNFLPYIEVIKTHLENHEQKYHSNNVILQTTKYRT